MVASNGPGPAPRGAALVGGNRHRRHVQSRLPGEGLRCLLRPLTLAFRVVENVFPFATLAWEAKDGMRIGWSRSAGRLSLEVVSEPGLARGL